MKVIVGLGNPGFEYTNTKHNLGFLAIDQFINELNLSERKEFRSLTYRYIWKNETVLFCKPQTFMNSSGEALVEIKNFYKLSNSDFLVIYDDLYIDTGFFKLSLSRGNGGHKGLQSIEKELGSNIFFKLRMGIGPRSKVPNLIKDYVLSKFTSEETQKNNSLFLEIKKIVEAFMDNLSYEQLVTLSSLSPLYHGKA
ncbi:hypothetical protein A6V39_01995 [Candidatus Mycoplasma haematobovis]|uniref:Peptidyl-tRNA hydrolase n=1 Tax=Candidatus Mycoplasma haematobovis TaxID=432608 RepID=A0A1A9QET8_9MOLU|nr:aminoacyl-tRNA hydrolase [Candidatus Mycoplasma haematobovis]OAL10200.1 hypothetical protein A6V39_01995 [Candidatus Mycoplasma haematobovis]